MLVNRFVSKTAMQQLEKASVLVFDRKFVFQKEKKCYLYNRPAALVPFRKTFLSVSWSFSMDLDKLIRSLLLMFRTFNDHTQRKFLRVSI
jgi:hypothetical protein